MQALFDPAVAGLLIAKRLRLVAGVHVAAGVGDVASAGILKMTAFDRGSEKTMNTLSTVTKTDRAAKLAELFASGASVREAAAAIGLSEPSVYRWLRRPLSQDLIAAASQRHTEVLAGKLSILAEKAIARLEQLLDGAETDTAKNHAIRLALEFAEKFNGNAALVRRIRALEARLQGKKSNGPRLAPRQDRATA